MVNYWRLVKEVIEKADVLLMILDARFVEETRNEELEWKISTYGKKLIYVINKADLVPKKRLEEWKKAMQPCVFVSAHEHHGMTILKKMLLKDAPVKVGVVGYPNTGKSSVINALRGRKSAPVSSKSGYTRSIQRIRIHPTIMLLDTPGVLPYGTNDEVFLGMVGAINPEKARDAEGIVYGLFGRYGKSIAKHYGVDASEDPDEFLERITVHTKKLKKGGTPDTERMARMLIKDWQIGKIPILEDDYAL